MGLSWPEIFGTLTRGESLGVDGAEAALEEILGGDVADAVVGAFILGLRIKGETAEEMTGMVRAMVGRAERVPLDDDVAARAVDTCGTGGDGSHSINVSTMAALVVAGAGVPVVKHGNRAASSRCGSADVLEALGVTIDAGPDVVARCVTEAGIGFCLAPRFHPEMRHVGPIRRQLGVATVFNYLGPLANPARVTRQVVGVSDPAMAPAMLAVLAANGTTDAMVVHGPDGLDEIGLAGPTRTWRLRDGDVAESSIDPAELGFERASRDALAGGDAAHNATVTRAVLGGESGPRRDVVVLNAAAALVVAGEASNMEAGVTLAARSIDDGSAAAALERLVEVSGG